MDTIKAAKVATEFGAYIREKREKLGLKQEDVAKQVGISRAYYTHIEAGDRNIYLATAIDICSALDLEFNEFVKQSVKR